MKEFYQGKKVLITGHTGFKGAWLSQILLAWGADVVGISLRPITTPNAFDALGLEGRMKNYFTDIRNLEEVQNIFDIEKPEIVFHLAAQALVRLSYDEPLKTVSTNCMGTTHILEAIRKTESVKSAVIITTDKVYLNREINYAYQESDQLGGHDPYSASKAAADIIVQSYIKSFFNPDTFGTAHATLVAIARAGNVIGGGDWSDYRLIPDVVRSVYHTKSHIEIRNPHAVRPWQHVLEPLSGYLMLGKRLYEGERDLSQAWNFGPHPESFMKVGDLIEEAKNSFPGFTHVVIPDTSKHEAVLLTLDINKAVHVLGWKPKMDFSQAISTTLDWYKKYYEKPEEIKEFTNNQIDIYFT
jgi:CDP-glucose 4,6-dehydratase